jgi:type IV secretion system protein VirD4
MTNEKIKKYVIPNLPYLFIFILFCNVGEAYRVSDGRNILFRCVNTLQNIGEALHNPFPALNINDWAFGIIGAVAVYLIVQYRRKNQKKWRKDVLFCKGRIFLCPKNQTVNAFAAHERKAETLWRTTYGNKKHCGS